MFEFYVFSYYIFYISYITHLRLLFTKKKPQSLIFWKAKSGLGVRRILYVIWFCSRLLVLGMRVPRHQRAGNRAAAFPENENALTKHQSQHLLSSLTLLPPALSFFPPFLPSKVLFPLGPGKSFEEEILEPIKTNFNKLKMSIVPMLNRGQLGSPSYGQSLVDLKSVLPCSAFWWAGFHSAFCRI